MNIPQIRRSIRDGQFDTELDRLQLVVNQEIKRKRRELSLLLADDFAIGQRVRTVPGNYKPRYLFNRAGTVVEIDPPWVWIELDEPVRRSGGGNTKVVRRIGVSAINLAMVEDEDGS